MYNINVQPYPKNVEEDLDIIKKTGHGNEWKDKTYYSKPSAGNFPESSETRNTSKIRGWLIKFNLKFFLCLLHYSFSNYRSNERRTWFFENKLYFVLN